MSQSMLRVEVFRPDLPERPPCSFEVEAREVQPAYLCGHVHCSKCSRHTIGIGGGRRQAQCRCGAPFVTNNCVTDDGRFCTMTRTPILHRGEVRPIEGDERRG